MTFVLAHLSDPHLAPLPQPRWPELMGKRMTGFLHWRRNRHRIHRTDVLAHVVSDLKANAPDHIAVTGDLVNISLAGEFAPARAWLESLGSPRDVTLVPGNHDAYVRSTAGLPQTYWGNYMRGDDGGGFPFLRRRADVALIGLSSAVPTAPLLGTGRLGKQQIGRLAHLLESCGRERLFRVVLIHHPPRSSSRRYFKRLVDGGRLRAVLAQYGAELVIHGHDHTRSLTYVDGPQRPIPVAGVPSASQIPREHHAGGGYNLYIIDGQPGAWRCEIDARGLAPDGESVTGVRRVDV
ncbi:MAG TPA: metallophosphoesterase [Xanthobacteraceae bacterium]